MPQQRIGHWSYLDGRVVSLPHYDSSLAGAADGPSDGALRMAETMLSILRGGIWPGLVERARKNLDSLVGGRLLRIIQESASQPASHDEFLDLLAQHDPKVDWPGKDMRVRQAVVKSEVLAILRTAIVEGHAALCVRFGYDGSVPKLKTPYQAQPKGIRRDIDSQLEEAADQLAILLELHPEEPPPAMTCKDTVAEVLQGTLFRDAAKLMG